MIIILFAQREAARCKVNMKLHVDCGLVKSQGICKADVHYFPSATTVLLNIFGNFKKTSLK